jgi:hypothetical protein
LLDSGYFPWDEFDKVARLILISESIVSQREAVGEVVLVREL